MESVLHTIVPVFDKNSTVLILGSFPSVKSREASFFYGHPQNRFWSVISAVFSDEVPETVEEKKAFLLKHKIALWDVISSCEIEGSSDSSIRNVVPNDISFILEKTDIKRIFVNGKTAQRYYNKYILPEIGVTAHCLPSTSPANAAFGLERLVEEWKIIRE